MGCTVCDSSARQFTCSNVGAWFPPLMCATWVLGRYLGCRCGLISEEELSHKHHLKFCFSDLWDEQKYIYGPLFPCDLLCCCRSIEGKAKITAFIRHSTRSSPPMMIQNWLDFFRLLMRFLNNTSRYIPTCLQRGRALQNEKSLLFNLDAGGSFSEGPCEMSSTSNAAQRKKPHICLLDTLHSYFL